ncbi:MAG: SH3 domain-containing protein [Pseudomonadota bacterium]
MRYRLWIFIAIALMGAPFIGQFTQANAGASLNATSISLPVAKTDSLYGPSGLPIPRFVALKKDQVRARFGPSFDYPVAYEFNRQGLPLKVIEEDRADVWRRVEDRDGRRMWIHRSMLASNEHAIIHVESAILRASPREDAAGRAKLTDGVMAEVENCAEGWCRLKAGKFRGWLPASTLWGV